MISGFKSPIWDITERKADERKRPAVPFRIPSPKSITNAFLPPGIAFRDDKFQES